jgi:nucleoside-diphosphate-sugar epimerase
MSERKIAVVGASGVVGRALLERCNTSGESAVGLSRRPPADLPDSVFIPLDLTDEQACIEFANTHLKDVTHLVYAALFEKPGLISGWREMDQMQTNLSMLENLLQPLMDSACLRHVTLLQGTKAYGAHVEPMRIPGLEREPRHPHENFYWLQQDYLENCCASTGWQFTIWRPQIIIGHALNAPMNMLAAIGVYAALQKASGLPLRYPGGPSAVTEAVDADLLAAAIEFSFDNAAFAGETFNITNGDVFRWQDIWPALAAALNMPVGEPEKRLLSNDCYEQELQWQQVVDQHGLRPYTIRQLVGDSFYYADALFNAYGSTTPPPAMLSTIKLRQAGFQACMDTEVMFDKWFSKLRALKVLPG